MRRNYQFSSTWNGGGLVNAEPFPHLPTDETTEQRNVEQTIQHTSEEEKFSKQNRIAYRVAREWEHRLMYVPEIGWFHWTGTYWAEDTGDVHATRAVMHTLETAWADAMTDRDLERDVKSCQTAAAMEGVLRIAGKLPAFTVPVDGLDVDPHLLNVANGTLDLGDLTLKAHDPVDRLTHITRAGWDPTVTCENWGPFMEYSLPDPEVRGFLQRYVGQALIGRTVEQKLVFLTGPGGNGKSVWKNAVEFALGTYAGTPPDGLLLSKKNHSEADGAVELRGLRWAVSSEVDKGRELAPAMVKKLTGGDLITSRKLYGQPITFRPSHALAMIVNHLPQVQDASGAMWRRLRVVPFDQPVPPDRQDPDLTSKMEAEADAVLAWAVEGLRDYQDRGALDEPSAVLTATDRYQEDSNEVSKFLAQVTQQAPGASAKLTQLHKEYERWAALNDALPLGRNRLGDELRDRGVRKDSRGQYAGLLIRQDWEKLS